MTTIVYKIGQPSPDWGEQDKLVIDWLRENGVDTHYALAGEPVEVDYETNTVTLTQAVLGENGLPTWDHERGGTALVRKPQVMPSLTPWPLTIEDEDNR